MFEDNKSRRNLMLVSSVIILSYLLDLKITTQTFSFMGLNIESTFNQSSRLYLILIFIQAYLIMRFWVSKELERDKFDLYKKIDNWSFDIAERSSSICFEKYPTNLHTKNIFWRYFLNAKCWPISFYKQKIQNYEGKNPFWIFLHVYWRPEVTVTSVYSSHTAAVMCVYGLRDGLLTLITPWLSQATNISVPIVLGGWAIGILGLMLINSSKTFITNFIVSDPNLFLVIWVSFILVFTYSRIILFPIRVNPDKT